MYRYDPASNTWATLPATNDEYRGGGACGLYQVGGEDTTNTERSFAEVLPPPCRSASSPRAPPSPLSVYRILGKWTLSPPSGPVSACEAHQAANWAALGPDKRFTPVRSKLNAPVSEPTARADDDQCCDDHGQGQAIARGGQHRLPANTVRRRTQPSCFAPTPLEG